ncbi:ABC-F family ATP-binding cassette domain-containing protein [Agathobacter ruminis]|uniref:Zinc/iron permease n=1 Tax=Agathobacter ruminis TaxID=1712665 RepID=A0A2G3E1W4_9FIRM|nr:ABC-F family ATP-binding cassette domain-containing protein [Agathobacter ruminis]MDC7301945.1 ABC-F family ATP-binding cassette domain-containing protein [Agathobacter ruminis]PHU37258.1 zinc/iron permease [Agathobacter ruminis]
MNVVNIEKLTKAYTDHLLFEEASFFVQEHEKVGIVGINGTGKSTLLKMVAGQEEPDEGNVIKANHVVISYLPQDPQFDDEKSVRENVLAQTENETEALTILTRLSITDLEQKVGEMSGGQRKKLALAIALSKPADLLLLDEPTNHLDYGMIEWLQKYLNGYQGTIIMVTHDRYFLDEVCDRIVEIDQSHIYSYDCNYSGFLERKAARYDNIRSSEQKRQNILRRELAWIRRGARARSTKQKAHIQRYEALRDMEAPKVQESLQMGSIATRMGRTTVELDRIQLSYDNRTIINDFSYIFLKQDRVGFVGNNGCGKTTLMKIIAGLLTPDSGNVTVGQTVQMGYFGQEIQWMNPGERVIDYIRETGEYIPTVDGKISASSMLERFLFTPEQQYSPIEKLSGGEKRRLALLNVLMGNPNFLILDEPTNDLDTETLAILEDYLENFPGIIVTVSHDRHFLDRVVHRIFAFERGEIHQYEGGYTDYLEKTPLPFWEEESTQSKSAMTSDSRTTWKKKSTKIKFTYQEQKEYETIEADIAALEERISDLEADILRNASSYGKLTELTAEKEACENELLEKMERWDYLENLAEQIRQTNES